jgi:hypothetical protein
MGCSHHYRNGKGDNCLYFEAETPGFSSFAISALTDEDENNLPDERILPPENSTVVYSERARESSPRPAPVAQSTPAFSALFTIGVLVIAGVISGRIK